MTELARRETISPQETPESSETSSTPIYQRLENEPLLWYNRFKLFRSLGVKRTLLAALLKEQEQVKVLKGTEIERKPRADRTKKRTKGHLAEVVTPKPAPAQVPGSWKRASIQWKWVERAEAYDSHRIDKMVEAMLGDYLDGLSLAFNRVMMLKNLYQTVVHDFNTNNRTMTHDQNIAYYTRMQSLIKQIADEMSPFDESAQRVLLRGMATKQYRNWTPPGDTKAEARVLADQLSAKAGGDDRLLAMIDDFDRKQQASSKQHP